MSKMKHTQKKTENEQNIGELFGNFKWPNMYVFRVPEAEEGERKIEKEKKKK